MSEGFSQTIRTLGAESTPAEDLRAIGDFIQSLHAAGEFASIEEDMPSPFDRAVWAGVRIAEAMAKQMTEEDEPETKEDTCTPIMPL